MNDKRRKELNEIFRELHALQGRLDDIQNEEQDAYDNLPESLQSAEKGEQMQEYINAIDQSKSDLETTMDTLAQLDFIEEIF
jgi:prefoldin subunit 5